MINERIGVFHGAKIDSNEFGAHDIFGYFEMFMKYIYQMRGEEPLTEDEIMENFDLWCDSDYIIRPEYMDFIFVGNFEVDICEDSEDCCVRLDGANMIEMGKIQFISFLKEQGINMEIGTYFIKYSY